MGFAIPDHSPIEKQHRKFDEMNRAQKRAIMTKFDKQVVMARNLIIGATGWKRDKVNLWFKTRNPLLGNMAPIFMIATGRGAKLIDWIEFQIQEN